MGNQIYIGNLSFSTTEESLRAALAQDGRSVAKLEIKTDKKSGKPRGFAFAELGSEEDVQSAVAALNGKDLDGRPIKVTEARERQVHTGGYGSSGGGGGGYGDRGGFGGRRGGGGGGGRRW